MTPEQTKVVHRCGRMMKMAFPRLAGKLTFTFATKGSPAWKADLINYNIGSSHDEEEITAVDLRE